MNIGERLRKLREGKYTQEELAEKMKVHSITISKWETGAQIPHGSRISELARVLGTTPAYLLGDTDNPDKPAEKSNALPELNPSGNDLVYERNGTRLVLPNTPETRTLFERLVMASMSRTAATA